MVTINVVKAFVLTLSEDVKKVFHVGRHTVEDDVAEHWYVKAHTGDAEEVAADTNVESQAQALAEANVRAEAAEKERDEALARAEAAEQALAALQATVNVDADAKLNETKGKK